MRSHEPWNSEGSQSDRFGHKTTTASAAISARTNFTAARPTFPAPTPVADAATKRLTPTGGVTWPMARLVTMTTPRWMSLTPNSRPACRKIGVKMYSRETASITHPSAKRVMLTNARKISGCPLTRAMPAASAVVAPVRCNTQAKTDAHATSHNTCADVVTDCLTVSHR